MLLVIAAYVCALMLLFAVLIVLLLLCYLHDLAVVC